MEEVLNSVKKKHRLKHRRKKEQKKLALMEAEQQQAAAEGGKVSAASTLEMVESHKNGKEEKRRTKKPLQEKSSQENGENRTKKKHKHRSPLKLPEAAVSSKDTLLKHFSRLPQEDADVSMLVAAKDAEATESKKPKTLNAFELLMNARNKTIGSNTPGQDADDVNVPESEACATAQAKRKQLLHEWAERKGGSKRKLDEEARAAYVEKKLQNRAKRFKRMLVNNNSAPNTPETNVASPEKKLKTSTQKKINKHNQERAPKRAGRRTRRLSSMESVESLGNTVKNLDVETAEFMEKLSSPTKKRDSLLGYFQVKESPTQLAAKEVGKEEQRAQNTLKEQPSEIIETPKRRGRPPRSALKIADVDSAISIKTELKILEEQTPSTGRPRRSCAGKARYDYDLEQSPTKLKKELKEEDVTDEDEVKKVNAKVNVKKEEIADEDDVIVLDDSVSVSSATPTPKKLAPLFVRNMPKPSTDPRALKARQDFLSSGVPEKMRLEMAKQKQFEQHYELKLELFPKLSHVLQLDAEELKLLDAAYKVHFKLRSEIAEEVELPLKKQGSARKSKGKLRCTVAGITACQPKDFRAQTQKSNTQERRTLPTLENKREIVKSWKIEFDRFPTYKCYNQMREKYRFFSALDAAQDAEQVTESFVVTRRTTRARDKHPEFEGSTDADAEYKPPKTAPNGELLFCEKYKPMLFDQVLVNLSPVRQLRDFLSNWSNRNGGASARNSQTLDDSLDFFNGDSNSSQTGGGACNSVVLLGPVSSGKTNAVYALANEMNFNVVEVNAGMKRTGKKLIQELQEATQSHQIRKDSPATIGKSQKNLLKMSLNGLKQKKPASQQLNDDSGSGGSTSAAAAMELSARKCLILIEDADIVFEQMDAGFTDAIYTLAASSKRPVIVVASNPNCQHLQRLMHQNTIQFLAPQPLNIAKFLAVLSLNENCPIHLDDLLSLYLYNGKDLRKTLLELQIFIQSGGDSALPAVNCAEKQTATKYFASPEKNRRPTETEDSAASETQLTQTGKSQQDAAAMEQQYHLHRTLFEFYTVGQNELWRIPFPINFQLLRINFNDIFQASPKLHAQQHSSLLKEADITEISPKRKLRSPKRTRAPNKTSYASKSKSKTENVSASTELNALCNFYTNISTAALLSQCNSDAADGLLPNISDCMAHDLVERSIIVDLAAEMCPYNLFDNEKTSESISENLTGISWHTRRARSLDIEPALRAICRSEQTRSMLERRSSRFYHYLRNSSANMCSSFAVDQYDAACAIFQDNDQQLERVQT